MAHFRDGTEGMGRKSRDESALPLCAACHRTGRLAYHRLGSEAAFCEAHNIHPPSFRKTLQGLFRSTKI